MRKMNIIKLIKLVYIGFTVFSLLSFSITNTTIFDIMPAIILMWGGYIFFKIGYKKRNKNYIEEYNYDKDFFSRFINNISGKRLLVLVIVILLSILTAYFYTGNTPGSVLKSLASGNSLYLDYQKYFKDNSLSSFSITKLPYIIMNVVLNILFIISIISIIAKKEKINFKDVFYLLMFCLSFWYFGLARGTNFEIFEIGCILLFSIYIRLKKMGKSISIKSVIIILFLAVMGITVFRYFIGIRTDFDSKTVINREIQYTNDKIIPQLFPGLANTIFDLTGYFGFGFFYTSAFVNNIMIQNPVNFISSLIPQGFSISGIDDITLEIDKYCNHGVMWVPDMINGISFLGLFGIFILFYFLGKICSKMENVEVNNNNLIIYVLSYYIFLQMVSFPIANFVFVSSSNKLSVIGSVIIYKMSKTKKIKEKSNVKENDIGGN